MQRLHRIVHQIVQKGQEQLRVPLDDSLFQLHLSPDAPLLPDRPHCDAQVLLQLPGGDGTEGKGILIHAHQLQQLVGQALQALSLAVDVEIGIVALLLRELQGIEHVRVAYNRSQRRL